MTSKQFSAIERSRRKLDNAISNMTAEREKMIKNIDDMARNTINLSATLENVKTNLNQMHTTTKIPGFFTGADRGVPTVIKKTSTLQKGAKKLTSRGAKKRSRRSSPWGSVNPNSTRVLTELEDDASVNITSSNQTKYQTKILESGIIAPSLGLVMEQTGSYMEYSGYIYVPIIYHMPHLASTGLVGKGVDCNITANKGHQEMIVSLLKEKIGTLVPHRHSLRKKRFIETAILGGAIAWNRASIWSLQDTVDSLNNQLNDMRKHSQIVTNSINTMIDNQHAIHHAVDRQARILREFMDRSTCEEMVTNYFREVYSTWLSLAPNDFARVVDSALSGKITPDMLPATDVLSVLLKHPAIVSTAYSKDMTLLYELGKFSLHQVTYDPYPMVSGVMIFPRVLVDRSAALMRVFTTHTETKKGYKKLKLPDVVACKDKGNCWSISPTACKEMLTLTLCPKTTKIEFNLCLQHIMDDAMPATNCEWKLSTDVQTEIIPFDGGILISASDIQGEIMITQGKELIVHKQIEPSKTPTVVADLIVTHKKMSMMTRM